MELSWLRMVLCQKHQCGARTKTSKHEMCSLLIIEGRGGQISACETAWTIKMLATKMSVCVTCTNDGALIIYQRSKGTRKKIIYVKEMYLFICSLQF